MESLRKRKKCNIGCFGESMAGKSCVIYYKKYNIFDSNGLATIGIESTIDEEIFDGELYKFKIYDTAGQERYRTIALSIVNILDGFLLFFSVTNKTSFN